MTKGSFFTGRARNRKTRRSIWLADVVSRALITGGGLGTILVVGLVCLFLVAVVLPLFLPSKVGQPNAVPQAASGQRPLYLAVDEYQQMGVAVRGDGRVEVFRLDTGQIRFQKQIVPPGQLTSASFLVDRPEAILGYADGSIQLAKLRFAVRFFESDQLPADVRSQLDAGDEAQAVDFGQGIIQRTPDGQYRLQEFQIELLERRRVSDGPVRLVDHVMRSSGPLICAITQSQPGDAYRLVAVSGREEEDFLSGEIKFVFNRPVDLPLEAVSPEMPKYLAVSGPGSDMFVGWEDGSLVRVRCGDLKQAFIAEKGRLTQGGATLTCLAFMLGNNTLIWGDSTGAVRAGFLVERTAEFDPAHGLGEPWHDPIKTSHALAMTKQLVAPGGPPLVSVASSQRSRLITGGFADGGVGVYNVTLASPLARLELPVKQPVLAVAVAPKEDGLLALTGQGLYRCGLEPRYHEVSVSSLFMKVWYEGYPQPQHTWQSSSGDDEFEPKLGLMPLVFGTLKATVYSMLFGAPIALLAAIFSSEFLTPQTKAVIKPTIELMASLPSVVLGFLAALVFAPFIEKVVPTTLMVFVGVPYAFLLGAYLWQLLPQGVTLRLMKWRLLILVIPAGVGMVAAAWLGPAVERWFFAGDLRGWLAWDGRGADAHPMSSATGGWMMLMLPLSGVAAGIAMNRWGQPWLRSLGGRLERHRLAWLDLGRFLVGTAVAVTLAWGVSSLLNGMGLDPRGSYIDTYVQRNALIVGFVMGFAVIPIIYTIADDALSAVPQLLRSGSLGAGATTWQTTVRIVIPTAMSGLFSALMVGLGRAVGETMIVLMAAGNTPIMEWNIFEGFRTLSANIAVELPEAVRNSTHYRTLFLAALALFVMTFCVNTVAELIRLRFRKRAYQL